MEAASPSVPRNALALLALIGSTVAALSLVPPSAFRQLQQPSARAAALMVIVLLAILMLRRLGTKGALRERQLLCIFLAAMPLVYLESGLWNGAGAWLLVEGAGLFVFAGWALLAWRRDALVLALGIAAHGLLWDSWHHASSYIPPWYGRACLVVDLGLALYVLLQRDRLAVSSQREDVAQPNAAEKPLPALDPQAAAIRADMLRELATMLRTLGRQYDELRSLPHGDVAERVRYTQGTQDLRTVLTRLRLLLPSLQAGRVVMPDLGAQQQMSACREQSEREFQELGWAAALARHTEGFQQAIDVLLATARKALGQEGNEAPSAAALDTLSEQADRAQRATLVLQLTLKLAP